MSLRSSSRGSLDPAHSAVRSAALDFSQRISVAKIRATLVRDFEFGPNETFLILQSYVIAALAVTQRGLLFDGVAPALL